MRRSSCLRGLEEEWIGAEFYRIGLGFDPRRVFVARGVCLFLLAARIHVVLVSRDGFDCFEIAAAAN